MENGRLLLLKTFYRVNIFLTINITHETNVVDSRPHTFNIIYLILNYLVYTLNNPKRSLTPTVPAYILYG